MKNDADRLSRRRNCRVRLGVLSLSTPFHLSLRDRSDGNQTHMRSPVYTFWVLAICAGYLQAAVVRGLVVDNYSGRPLARTLVRLKSIEGYAATNLAVRTDRLGVFTFPPVGTGAYLLTAARPGFAPLQFGQKAWNAPGTPIFLQPEVSTFLQLRLQRLGAITGSLWDENEIGFPDQDIAVYRATRPPKLAGRTKTDDRGAYRFGGLEPGLYLVRNLARQIDEETGLLPTFYKEVALVEDAAPVQVTLEGQAADVNVRPLFGKLCQLTGVAYPPPQTLMLVSDMGEMAGGADSSGRFTFENLAPGSYELVATASMGRSQYGAYQKITIERDREVSVNLTSVPAVQIVLVDQAGKAVDRRAVEIMARRTTLGGLGAATRLRDGAAIHHGRWEVSASPTSDFFPASITVDGHDLAPGGRADGWHEFQVAGGRFTQIQVVLSSRPAGVQGKVTGPGNDPMIGAPVFLESIDADSHKRLKDLTATRTDARGAYQFNGLPPGTYRLLSTFDFDNPDVETMEAALAKTVILQEGKVEPCDLDFYTK
jgi:hypothetical protein